MGSHTVYAHVGGEIVCAYPLAGADALNRNSGIGKPCNQRISSTAHNFAGLLDVEICLPVVAFDYGLRHILYFASARHGYTSISMVRFSDETLTKRNLLFEGKRD